MKKVIDVHRESDTGGLGFTANGDGYFLHQPVMGWTAKMNDRVVNPGVILSLRDQEGRVAQGGGELRAGETVAEGATIPAHLFIINR